MGLTLGQEQDGIEIISAFYKGGASEENALAAACEILGLETEAEAEELRRAFIYYERDAGDDRIFLEVFIQDETESLTMADYA